jgi:hypothetical protein
MIPEKPADLRRSFTLHRGCPFPPPLTVGRRHWALAAWRLPALILFLALGVQPKS